MKTMNKKVVFSPDTNRPKNRQTCRGSSVVTLQSASLRNNHHLHYKTSSSSSSSTMRFLKRVGVKVAKALGFGSGGKKWSGKVSASSSSSSSVAAGPGLVRTWSYAESVTLDSQRAEAIEDCIEFLNSSSSSSLQRSFSTASCSSR